MEVHSEGGRNDEGAATPGRHVARAAGRLGAGSGGAGWVDVERLVFLDDPTVVRYRGEFPDAPTVALTGFVLHAIEYRDLQIAGCGEVDRHRGWSGASLIIRRGVGELTAAGRRSGDESPVGSQRQRCARAL